MSNTIAFENFLQLVLWKTEIKGQLSDGQWENATPMDHWKPWCRATAIVDENNVGRNFFPRREKYNLTAPDFLDAVGDRMCYRLGLASSQPSALKKLWEMQGHREPACDADWDDTADYMKKYQAQWIEAGLTRAVVPVASSFLKRVLNSMKVVMKTYRSEPSLTRAV